MASLDRINTAIVNGTSRNDMLDAVLDEILEIFDCDRAWVVQTIKADPKPIRLLAERYRPGFEGALARDGAFPNWDAIDGLLEISLNQEGPVRFDRLAGRQPMIPQPLVDRYNVRSQMVMHMRPLNQDPWLLGIHHCRVEHVYDQAEPLFGAIARRLGDGVTTHLTLDELRQNEKRYRVLVDHGTEATVIFDLDSNQYVDANPAAARFFGVPVETLIGSRGPAGFAPEFQPDGVRSVDRAKQKMELALAGEFPSFEWVQLRPDGEEVPCHSTLSRLPDPTRRLVRVNMVDITERKKSEQERALLQSQLAQAQKLEAVGQMTGGVAHDFNNLLSVILGNLEMLQENTPLAEAAELIDPAIKATMRGADLTRKMLSFARRAQLEPTVLNLNEIVRDMDNWMRRTLSARIDVHVSLADGLWPVEADLASSESALLNLVINARDAMSEGGALTITTANCDIGQGATMPGYDELAPGRYVMLMVSDTGVGMGENELKKVFEPFFTTKRMTESSGLGLSMVHGFMRQSGGGVHIESEPGQGASVRLYFKAKETPQAIAAAPASEQPAQVARSARVLLAEDQEAVADILVRILKNKGYQVVVGYSGDAALELFRSEGPFDMVLTDIVMPGKLQGPALAQVLREIEPDLPVVFMSGYASENVLEGDGMHDDDIRLMKPVSRALLLESVAEALKKGGV